MIKLINSKGMNIFLLILTVGTLIIGNVYLFSLMSKIRLMAEETAIEKKIRQLNSDISKLKIEIDEKVDLDRIEKTATKDLKMHMAEEVNYIKYE